jgi:hypothetical protein
VAALREREPRFLQLPLQYCGGGKTRTARPPSVTALAKLLADAFRYNVSNRDGLAAQNLTGELTDRLPIP